MNFISSMLSKKKKVTIEFCEKNLDRFLSEDNFPKYNKFLIQKNIIYKEYQCQSKCELCSQVPYAVVDGETVQAENSIELLQKMQAHINK